MNSEWRSRQQGIDLASKVHGDRSKTCDSMYDVACLLCEHGRSATASELLNGLTRIADTLDEGEGQAARAYWKASTILKDQERDMDANASKAKAVGLRRIIRPKEDGKNDDEGSWERLTPYMLW